MKDAQKPEHVSLNTLVSYLRDGRFVIPDFQVVRHIGDHIDNFTTKTMYMTQDI